MAANRADFTLTFRRLCDAAAGPEGDAGVRALFADPGAYDSWAVAWRQRLDEEPVSAEARAAAMRMANPAFIPRNHLVEAALDAAVGGRTSSRSRSCWTLCHAHTRTGRSWSGTPRQPAPRSALPRLSAGRERRTKLNLLSLSRFLRRKLATRSHPDYDSASPRTIWHSKAMTDELLRKAGRTTLWRRERECKD